MCGPTGVGFLYGKSELLQDLPPFMGKRPYYLDMQSRSLVHCNLSVFFGFMDECFFTYITCLLDGFVFTSMLYNSCFLIIYANNYSLRMKYAQLSFPS